MGYLNEDGLARYDGLVKQWVTFKSGTVDGIDPLLNWQKTETAASVTCYPLPAAPLDPVVNFAFTETGPAEGTKGPDNPSTIAGVTQAKVTRCGKNLLSPPNDTRTRNGITLTNNNDGTYTVNGTASADTNFNFRSNLFLPAGTYIISGCPSGGSASTFAFGTSGGIRDYGSGATFSLENLSERAFWVQVSSGATVTNVTFKPQLELGSAATAFEPYEGVDYTVNLGDTYYGGAVDLSAGTMTVTHVMVEPDSLSFDISAHPADTASFQYADTFGRTVTTDGNTLTITGETGGKIVYNLATPETVSLSPLQIYSLSQTDPYTPRLNTVYSDQQSVQVGYPKSPIATASELTNAIVSLGSNL